MEHEAWKYRKLVFGDNSRYTNASIAKIECTEKVQNTLYNWLKSPKGFLVLYGKPGKGKTYFCAAAFEMLVERYGLDFRYWKEMDFLERLREYVSEGKNYSSELKYMLDYKFMIFDDLGSTGKSLTDWRQEVMFTSIDTIYSNGRPAIITSNLGFVDMKEFYGERFASRVFAAENTIICVDSWPDFRVRGQ